MLCIQPGCPLCMTGAVGFRRCAPDAGIVLMCDECNAVWLSPEGISTESALYPQGPDFVVPTLNCSIRRPLSDWADRDDVARVGWARFIHLDGKALDEP